MRHIFWTAILLMAFRFTSAQISSELLVGNRQVHYISYWQKDFDSSGKSNLFNLNRFVKDFKDKSYSNLSTDVQISYCIKKWFGVAVGAGYNGEAISPSVGFSISLKNKKGDFLLEAYPTVGIAKHAAPGIFTLVGYNPKIKPKWGLSSQLIFALSGISTSQLVRIGINLRDKLNFGMGADISTLSDNQVNLYNFGVFIRLNL